MASAQASAGAADKSAERKNAGQGKPGPDRAQLFIDAFLTWMEVQKGASQATLKAYGSDLGQLAEFLRGQQADLGRPQGVTKRHIQAYLAWLFRLGEAKSSMLDGMVYTVSSEFPARVESVMVREGDHVKKGQVVARLDASNYARQLAAAGSEGANLRVMAAPKSKCCTGGAVPRRFRPVI